MLKVSKFQNENMKLSHCPKYERKNLKLEAKGQEFAKFLRSLEQFIQTVKGQNNFW